MTTTGSDLALGALFPQYVFGTDAAEISGYARAIEELGYDHLIAYDHVLGVDASRWSEAVAGFGRPPYTAEDRFTEILALYAYLSAWTSRMTLATSVLVLPQRQTALVAKQAAAINVFSGGRLRLSVGVGWNEFEYQGMGQPFGRNGAMLEEQISVLRRLWSEPLVDFTSERHQLVRTGINPLPPHPIPIWMGTNNGDRALKRVARCADGWMALLLPDQDLAEAVGRLRAHLEAADRDPAAFPIEARIMVPEAGPGPWLDQIDAMRALGVSHLVVFAVDRSKPSGWWLDYYGTLAGLLR